MQIQYQDLSFEVYKRLKTMILSEEFKPGEKLKQEHIAKLLGVSRMPLHKAFQMLEDEMLVENLPRRGFYVTKIDHNLMLDVFECREVLEGLAVRRAVKVITKEDLDYLKSLFKPFCGKKKVDNKKYMEADQEFHNSLLLISGNEALKRFENVRNVLFRAYRGGLIREPVETLPEHLGIIDALENQDEKLVVQLTLEHSTKTQKVLVGKIEEETKSKFVFIGDEA
ncbi:MAG: GntR family transcriptional regulator [Fibrobacteria bacterium]|nr:GntR family transcriptional regulator [Fibrobacteria bacterium]